MAQEHMISLAWLAAWPVLIYVFYRISFYVLKKKNLLYEEDEQE